MVTRWERVCLGTCGTSCLCLVVVVSSPKSDKVMLILARQRCVRTICGCLCKGVCVFACLILVDAKLKGNLFYFSSFALCLFELGSISRASLMRLGPL